MKIILSRKGFDSANGGIVSPIFENGDMVSFPIPSDDIDCFNLLTYKGISYDTILKNLNYKGVNTCHVDPDLVNRRDVQPSDWKPIFGQIGSSASYLLNTVKVEPGDLFLFFGNFHCVREENGSFKYIKNSGDFYKDNDLQVIWGYLQVGEIITNPKEQQKYCWHPHSCMARTSANNNIMFLASKTLSLNPNMAGAGVFNFDEKRVLTLKGATKATWKKETAYDIDNVLSKRRNSAKDKANGIYYAGIWQELGLKENEISLNWAKSLI